MRFIRVYLRSLNMIWTKERTSAIALIATAVFVGFLGTIEPVLFGKVIDALSGRGNVISILTVWGCLGVFNIAASVFLAIMTDRLAHRQRLDTLDQVFERAIALPVSYHSEQGSGRVVHAILSGTDQLFHLWLSFLRDHLSAIVGIIFLVPIAMSMDWRMASMLFGLAIVYGAMNFTVMRRTQNLQAQVETLHQTVFARIGDVIGNVSVVQSYTRLLDEIRELQSITQRVLSAQYPILTWWGLLSVITRISATLTIVSILALGSWLMTRGELTVGQVVAFASFSGLLIGKLEQVSGFISNTISRTPALENFFRLLDASGAAAETPQARAVSGVRGNVRFEHVTYKHKNTNVGVFDLCFSAEAGQTIALVGPSGSGKTTTLALLQRLFDPQEGTIYIDDHNIQEFTLSSLRQAIATVFQDSGLFNRSVAENIRVGRPGATDAELVRAAEQAAAHEFILKKPGGYEFVIGERGQALSGGERQRIAISRAILKDAPILIFDEATSALDNQTERRIQQAIANLRVQEKTTFIIAHRLSTVISADLILVFENGYIVESGTFSSLRAQNGLFADLLRSGELTPSEIGVTEHGP